MGVAVISNNNVEGLLVEKVVIRRQPRFVGVCHEDFFSRAFEVRDRHGRREMENAEDFFEGIFRDVEVVCFRVIVDRRRLMRAVLRQFVRHFSFILREDNPEGGRSEASSGGKKYM